MGTSADGGYRCVHKDQKDSTWMRAWMHECYVVAGGGTPLTELKADIFFMPSS